MVKLPALTPKTINALISQAMSLSAFALVSAHKM